MAKRKFRFVASEVRDAYNSDNLMAMEGDIVVLDTEDPKQAAFIRQITGEDREHDKSENWAEVQRGDATIHWEETPEIQDPAKIVERFIMQYRGNEDIRRQAVAKGLRLMDLGEQQA